MGPTVGEELVANQQSMPDCFLCCPACSDDETALVKSLYLLTMKPMIYAANVAEGDMADRGASSQYVQALRVKADEDNCEVVVISAQVRSQPSSPTM